MPLGTGYAEQRCAMARALAILGERWTLLIVRDAFHGLTRFDEFHRSLGVATNVLGKRLATLVDVGILERDAPRGGYHLTAKGRDLHPVVITLMAWADRHEPGEDGPEVHIRHSGCGHDAGGALRCEHCDAPVGLADLVVVPAGGGARTPPQLAAWGPDAG
jgi:DNA-binding HxlR family transcriptional regulator